jgi:hypothetical protein
MSAIRSAATGGDGWSTWRITRKGDTFTIIVYSNNEQVRQATPSGWGSKILLEETIRDDVGRTALDRAISFSAAYANRMAS